MRVFTWAVFMVAVVGSASAGGRTPACPDGCFRVEGDPLLGVEDTVVIEGRLVSTRTSCAPKKAKLRQGGRRRAVRWKRCGEARKVRLKATFPEGDCDRLDGAWRRRGGPRRAFSAVRGECDDVPASPCGDGVVDASIGEVCDDGNQ